MENLTVSVIEASQRLGLGLSTTKNLVARGDIKSILVGRRRLIPAGELERFIEERLAVGERESS
jgi:excisionase family DNA binding protein